MPSRSTSWLASILILLYIQIEAKAAPSPVRLAGVNVGGLKASLNTNLFNHECPLTQLANGIGAGLSGLAAGIQTGGNDVLGGTGSGAVTLEGRSQWGLNGGLGFPGVAVGGGLNGALGGQANGLTIVEAQTPQSQQLIGVNIGGLKAGITTNLFSKNGPLDKLDHEIQANANAFMNGLNGLASGAIGVGNGLSGGLAVNGEGQGAFGLGGSLGINGGLALPSIGVEGNSGIGVNGGVPGLVKTTVVEVEGNPPKTGSLGLGGSLSLNGGLAIPGISVEENSDEGVNGAVPVGLVKTTVVEVKGKHRKNKDNLEILGNIPKLEANGELDLSQNGKIEAVTIPNIFAGFTLPTFAPFTFPSIFPFGFGGPSTPKGIEADIKPITIPSLSFGGPVTIPSLSLGGSFNVFEKGVTLPNLQIPEIKLPSFKVISKQLEKDIGDIKVANFSASLDAALVGISKNPTEIVEHVSEAFPTLNIQEIEKISSSLKVLVPEIEAVGQVALVALPEIAVDAEFPELLILPVLLETISTIFPELTTAEQSSLKQFAAELKAPNLKAELAAKGKLPTLPPVPLSSGVLSAFTKIFNSVITNINIEANPQNAACVKNCLSTSKAEP